MDGGVDQGPWLQEKVGGGVGVPKKGEGWGLVGCSKERPVQGRLVCLAVPQEGQGLREEWVCFVSIVGGQGSGGFSSFCARGTGMASFGGYPPPLHLQGILQKTPFFFFCTQNRSAWTAPPSALESGLGLARQSNPSLTPSPGIKALGLPPRQLRHPSKNVIFLCALETPQALAPTLP